MPRVISIDPKSPDPAAIAEAAAVLARGGLVAFPTETVYGLGARGLHPDEVARIFAAKGRPRTHPLILHVEGEEMAKSLAAVWSEAASRLAAAFWPGPLTLVVPRGAAVPDEVTAGLDSVALRSPAHPIALALVRAVGEPLAAPSANAHTHVSPTSAKHVLRSLGDRVDFVLDGGGCAHGIESTVVTLAEDPPRVLRPGAASLARIRAVVPETAYDGPAAAPAGAPRVSPGLASKHYAPRSPLVLAGDAVTEAIERARAGEYVGALLFGEGAGRVEGHDRVRVVAMPEAPEEYARALYDALYALDEERVDVVVIERPPATQAWWAVVDRLVRAAG